jgi:hypothetical protein
VATPARSDLALYQGDTWMLRVDFEDADASPLDVSACSFRVQIRQTTASAVLAAPAVDVSDAATGTVRFSLTDVETAALSDRAVWDLEQTDGDGIVTTLVYGQVRTGREVTR